MRTTTILTAAAAAGILALAQGVSALARPDVTWSTGQAGFMAAAEQAQKEGKPVVLFSYDDDDAPFKDTDAAFQDAAVGALAEKFVFVKIDSEAVFWKNNLREAFDGAPWIYVLDPRLEKPCSEPLAKVVGEHKPGGGITAARIKETLTAALAKYADAKREGVLPKILLEGPAPAPTAKEPAKADPAKAGEDRAILGIQTVPGVPVSGVAEGSAAAKAGMKAGDVIVAVERTRVARQEDLLTALAKHKPGDAITVVIVRDNRPMELSVTLGSALEYAKAHPPVAGGEEEGEEGEEGAGGEGSEEKEGK